jgi:ribonuclease P protein component
MGHTFPKTHRLGSRSQKERLLKEGKKVFSHPVLLRWLPRAVPDINAGPTVAGDCPAQVMFLVAKKKFPRAVDRNSIRRKLREAWRQHAQDCLPGTSDFVYPPVFLVHYVAAVTLSYADIREALCDALGRLPRQEVPTSSAL